MRPENHCPDSPTSEPDILISNRLLTIPNAICLIRLAGSILLVPVAVAGQSELFLWMFVFLAMTDWFDGKLAILLNQRTVIGARLDSWADAALYAALAFGLLWMYGATLSAELPWIAVALGSYGLSTMAGLIKYRRWPSYHTRAAKTSWFLTLVAVICLFMDWSLIPAYIAVVAVILTNLEALAITKISPVWRADVTSVFHAWKQRG
ncbi:MAG: CDP-alcohol phosphatidyltransferase family protein [Pseudohongiellaceae bacterium]